MGGVPITFNLFSTVGHVEDIWVGGGVGHMGTQRGCICNLGDKYCGADARARSRFSQVYERQHWKIAHPMSLWLEDDICGPIYILLDLYIQ